MDPDPGILAQLREIDPKADAIWVPGPLSRGERWDVGRWFTPTQWQRAGALYALDRQFHMPVAKQSPARMRWAWDLLRGWRSAFHTNGPLDGRAVEEFRRRYYVVTNRLDKALDEALRWHEDEEKRHEEELSRTFRDMADDTWAWKRAIGHKMVHTHGIRDGMPSFN